MYVNITGMSLFVVLIVHKNTRKKFVLIRYTLYLSPCVQYNIISLRFCLCTIRRFVSLLHRGEEHYQERLYTYVLLRVHTPLPYITYNTITRFMGGVVVGVLPELIYSILWRYRQY